MTVKYRIQVMESERGWGSNFWHEDYDTYDEAKQRIELINSKNTALVAPDYYMQVEETIQAIENQD